MITLLIYVAFVIACGRMTRKLRLLNFAILFVSMLVYIVLFGVVLVEAPVAGIGFFIVLTTALYVLGYGLGRWLDRDKYEE